MARHPNLPDAILEFMAERAREAGTSPSAEEITARVGVSRPTVNRALARLVAARRLVRDGAGPATRYQLPANLPTPANADLAIAFTPDARILRAALAAPLGTRAPVTYQRRFVDEYVPNESALLPRGLAMQLYEDGRARGQQPAGTYARKVLEQLLIDLSWHSSRLEGNQLTLLDTRELFKSGIGTRNDVDTTMLLNHKDAIEFMVDAVPEQGITIAVVRNIQSVLMQGLLADPNSVGAIRRKLVNIDNSVYLPSQVPTLLEEMLTHIIDKARAVRSAVEAAFFLWVQIAYLQPFEDGNKRTSRLAANLPLFLSNCAPLSFLDVGIDDYAYAMLSVYERNDPRIAVELFEWTYRRSIEKYRVVRESLGAPDPLRTRYREFLGDLVRRVVGGEVLTDLLASSAVPDVDRAAVTELASQELAHLEPYNCARFRLSIPAVERWISAGRLGS